MIRMYTEMVQSKEFYGKIRVKHKKKNLVVDEQRLLRACICRSGVGRGLEV